MFIDTITGLVRHGYSTRGTPRYEVQFADHTPLHTDPDGAVNYEIQNPGYHGVPVEVYLTLAGRIYDVRIARPADVDRLNALREKH